MGIMLKANEDRGFFLGPEAAYADKELFVSNIGWLLSQTREEIISCRLKDNDTAVIEFKGGGTRLVNIAMDSYMAIVREIAGSV